MTDLEITRLCAKALEIYPTVPESYSEDGLWCFPDGAIDSKGFDFNPLHDDAQAMALENWLVQRGAVLQIGKHWLTMWTTGDGAAENHQSVNKGLESRRRFVCECVAKMQAAKGTE